MPEESRTQEISENLIKALMQFKRLRMESYPPDAQSDETHNYLKHSEVILLFALKRMEGRYQRGLSISELSSFLCVKPPSITPILNSLEQKNLLERNIDLNDRRIIRVVLKEEGKNIIQKMNRFYLSEIKGLVEYLGEDQCVVFTDLINKSFQFMISRPKNKNCNLA